MAFCKNCGTKVEDGMKFCASCGKPIEDNAPAAASRPATEKVGNIKKCPACGAEVESFQTRCASCGHEFNDARVEESVKDFFTRIDDLERENFVKGDAKTGKSSMGIWIAFIVLLLAGTLFMYMACWELPYIYPTYLLPALITYIVAIVIIMLKKPGWTVTDERRQSLIENYPLPNTKEAITEFTILAKSKINKVFILSALLLNSGKYKKEWNAIWAKKLSQVYSKARLSMSGDAASLAAIKDMIRETGIKL
jgi:DNA-directed RNA polymerase subunit RPC12/RpoP